MPGSLYQPASNSVPQPGSSTAAAAGSSAAYARGDHKHPRYVPDALDHGYLAWNYDISTGSTSYILTASGTITVCKLPIPIAMTVTNVVVFLSVLGATLTAGQSFIALYDPSKNWVVQTADLAATFSGTTGEKVIPFTSPQSIAAGTYWLAIWSNGTTMPSFRSKSNLSSANAGLSAANSRWATANTGVTTTAPASLGAFTAVAGTPWIAVS